MPADEMRNGSRSRKDSRSILSHEYVSEVLVALLKKGTVKCDDLSCIITSPTTRRKVLGKMREAHLLDIRMKTSPRKTYFITLTQYGVGIAQRIREAYDMMGNWKPEVENASG